MSKVLRDIKKEIKKSGDVVTVKETEITTTVNPGKKPEVKEVTRVQEFKGQEGYNRLPSDVRQQLERWESGQISTAGMNMEATRGNFIKDCLEEHNKFRKMHGVGHLKISKELVKISEARAKEMAAKDEITYTKEGHYGENISKYWSTNLDHFIGATEVVSRWYSEGMNYKYDKNPTDNNAVRFTQLIWEGSKDFGIAAAKSNQNVIYVIALYHPPGNVAGEFTKNVHCIGYER